MQLGQTFAASCELHLTALVAAISGLAHWVYSRHSAEVEQYSDLASVLIALWSLGHPLEPPAHPKDQIGRHSGRFQLFFPLVFF